MDIQEATSRLCYKNKAIIPTPETTKSEIKFFLLVISLDSQLHYLLIILRPEQPLFFCRK